MFNSVCIKYLSIFYLQFDQRLHNYIKRNNYVQHAPTGFDI